MAAHKGESKELAPGDLVIVSTTAHQYVMRVTAPHSDGSATGVEQNKRAHQREAFSDKLTSKDVPIRRYAFADSIIDKVVL